MESGFSLGKSQSLGRKRAGPNRSIRCKASETVARAPSSYIVRTEHDEKFMEPFLRLVRASYPSDNYKCCRYHVNLIRTTPLKKGQIDPGFTGNFTPWTRDEKSLDIIEECLNRNEGFRWNMRHLIHRWRIAKCQQMNTEDIFTCEVPRKTVTIYDWNQRAKYVFEATTVFRDVSSKLRHASGLFICPLAPKNPFTNKELTYGQIHFTVQALIRYGFSNWILDAFRKSDYSTMRLIEFYEYPLKHDNLVQLFRNPKDEETIELIYDCICEEYIHHGITMPFKAGWRVALEENPDLPIIQRWRGLALKREKLLSRYEDGDYLIYKLQDIHRESYDLIASPVDSIGHIYNKHLNKKTTVPAAQGNTGLLSLDTLLPYNDLYTFTEWYNYLSAPLYIPLPDNEEPLDWENDLAFIVIDYD